MNEIEATINQQDLAQLIHLLEIAQSPDNAKQIQVYDTLKKIEEHPTSYIYLTYLFANDNLSLNLRKLAGSTMSSAIKRNCSVLHFQPIELMRIKYLLLDRASPIQLTNIKSNMISGLINKQNFDYDLFSFLISGLRSNLEHITMVNGILEDLKFKAQNYNIFEEKEFIKAIENIYNEIFGLISGYTIQEICQNVLFQQYLKCINLLTFHCPKSLYRYLSQYVQLVIQPILIQSQKCSVNESVVILCLQGVNEIVATKSSLIKSEIIFLLVNYHPFSGNLSECNKCWTNIMLDLIDNDENEGFSQHLQIVLPKAIQGLTFTVFDQRNIKEQMQIQYNPYSEEARQLDNDIQDNEVTIYEASYGSTSGYTLRKLSFQLIEKISISFSQKLWNNWNQFIIQKLQSLNIPESQTAICFIGIIAETCLYDMTGEIQSIVLFLIDKASEKYPSLLRATSLWALQKILPIIQENTSIIMTCLQHIFVAILQHPTQGTHTAHLMLKQSSLSFLDQIVSQQKVCPAINAQILHHIIKSLTHGLKIFKGRALFNIFKAISSIFQNQHFNKILNEPLCNVIISELCKKWQVSQKNDSVMCPLLQCLITGCEGKRVYFEQYYTVLFQQVLPLLRLVDRKALVLRCIDLMSSIINGGSDKLNSIILSPNYIQLVYSLVTAEQKEVRHFTYGLISDIGKKYNISTYVDKLIMIIAQTMDEKSLTSKNNALMCLTDLLTCYSTSTLGYVPQILTKVAQIIRQQKLQNIFALNFSRIYGRLSLINPLFSKNLILKDKKLVSFLFLSLRTREITQITTDSFKGLIATFTLFSTEEISLIYNDLQCVIEALVCYPIRRESSAQNEILLNVFINFVRSIKGIVGPSKWSQLMKCPIFMPGALNTLNAWTT